MNFKNDVSTAVGYISGWVLGDCMVFGTLPGGSEAATFVRWRSI